MAFRRRRALSFTLTDHPERIVDDAKVNADVLSPGLGRMGAVISYASGKQVSFVSVESWALTVRRQGVKLGKNTGDGPSPVARHHHPGFARRDYYGMKAPAQKGAY